MTTQKATAKEIIADLSPELQAEYNNLAGNVTDEVAVGTSTAGDEVKIVGNSEPVNAMESSTEEDATETTQESTEETNESEEDQLSKLKEQRKRMFAQINKEKSENEKLQAELSERNKLIEEAKELAGEDAPQDQIAKSMNEVFEKQDFIKEFQPSSDELAGIKEIKEQAPGLNWRKAALLYAAENNPEMLIDKAESRKAEVATTVQGTQPNINEPVKSPSEMTNDELRELALKQSIHRF